MTDHRKSHGHTWAHSTLSLLLAALIGGVLLLWGWNTIAVDLFTAPAASFKHAVAAQAGIAGILLLPFLLIRGARQRKRPEKDQ